MTKLAFADEQAENSHQMFIAMTDDYRMISYTIYAHISKLGILLAWNPI